MFGKKDQIIPHTIDKNSYLGDKKDENEDRQPSAGTGFTDFSGDGEDNGGAREPERGLYEEPEFPEDDVTEPVFRKDRTAGPVITDPVHPEAYPGEPAYGAVRTAGTDPGLKKQDFRCVINAGGVEQYPDRRRWLPRWSASLFQGVPFGAYAGDGGEGDGERRRPKRTAWQLTAVREDSGETETVLVYGFVQRPIRPGRYRIAGVRNRHGEIEADVIWDVSGGREVSIPVEQLPAAFIRIATLLCVALPVLLICLAASRGGLSVDGFIAANGDYILFYGIAILIAVLWIAGRIQRRRGGRRRR